MERLEKEGAPAALIEQAKAQLKEQRGHAAQARAREGPPRPRAPERARPHGHAHARPRPAYSAQWVIVSTVMLYNVIKDGYGDFSTITTRLTAHTMSLYTSCMSPESLRTSHGSTIHRSTDTEHTYMRGRGHTHMSAFTSA